MRASFHGSPSDYNSRLSMNRSSPDRFFDAPTTPAPSYWGPTPRNQSSSPHLTSHHHPETPYYDAHHASSPHRHGSESQGSEHQYIPSFLTNTLRKDLNANSYQHHRPSAFNPPQSATTSFGLNSPRVIRPSRSRSRSLSPPRAYAMSSDEYGYESGGGSPGSNHGEKGNVGLGMEDAPPVATLEELMRGMGMGYGNRRRGVGMQDGREECDGGAGGVARGEGGLREGLASEAMRMDMDETAYINSNGSNAHPQSTPSPLRTTASVLRDSPLRASPVRSSPVRSSPRLWDDSLRASPHPLNISPPRRSPLRPPPPSTTVRAIFPSPHKTQVLRLLSSRGDIVSEGISMESAGGTMTVDVTYADEIGCAGALELEGQEVGGARIVVMRVAGGKNGLFGQMRGGRVALEESADEEHFDSGSRVLYEDEDDKAPMVRGQSMWSRVLNVIYGW